MFYFWRALFVYGKKMLWLDGVFVHTVAKYAEEEADIIRETIGIEEYARAKGIDLTKWKLEGVYLCRTEPL